MRPQTSPHRCTKCGRALTRKEGLTTHTLFHKAQQVKIAVKKKRRDLPKFWRCKFCESGFPQYLLIRPSSTICPFRKETSWMYRLRWFFSLIGRSQYTHARSQGSGNPGAEKSGLCKGSEPISTSGNHGSLLHTMQTSNQYLSLSITIPTRRLSSVGLVLLYTILILGYTIWTCKTVGVLYSPCQ